MDDQSLDTPKPTEKEEKNPEAVIVSLPTIDFFVKRYANPTGDDKKGLWIFRQYEPDAKVRMLRAELASIKSGKVVEAALDKIVGKKRKVKHDGGYIKWAEIVTLWMSSKQ